MKMLPPELIRIGERADDSVSSYLPVNKAEQGKLIQMRAQLWDAHRLSYIILGEGSSIRGSGSDLENGTLLRAIRTVAEIKEEMAHLTKCLELCYQREKRHRCNFKSKEELRHKCQTSEYQLAQQRLEYQALQATHQEYVQDTMGQLQELYELQSQNRGSTAAAACKSSSVHSHQDEEEDPQESQAYQKLFVRVAKASVQPQMNTLQGELRASREETRRAQQQSISQKEEMEYAIHVEALATALKRAACQQQGTRSSNISGGVTSGEIKEVLSKLQSMSPTSSSSSSSSSSFQERQEMQVTILKLLQRLAANNPTRETVHDLKMKLAATTQQEKVQAAQLKDLLAELKVIEWEKQEGQKELHTTEAWYQEKLHASMEQEKEQQAEIKELDAQLDELAVVAVHVEDLESELETSRQQYETELEQTRLREQTSSKKVAELESQLKQVMEDQQRSLLLKSAATSAADKNAEATIRPPQEMEEEWRLQLQLQLKDVILSYKDNSSTPCLTPADSDSSHSHSEDDCVCSLTKKNFVSNDERDAVVVKEDAPRLWGLQQALNNGKELRETQEQLIRSQHRIAELEKRLGRQKGGAKDASTSTQSTGLSTWLSLDPESSGSPVRRGGQLSRTSRCII
jgi:myosin heavy subunit